MSVRLAVEKLLEIRYKSIIMEFKVEIFSKILRYNKAVVMNMQLPSNTFKKRIMWLITKQ